MAEEKKDPSESDKMDIETKEVTPGVIPSFALGVEKAEAKTEEKAESKESGVEQKEPSKGCTLVVKNLTGNTNEAHLREIFRNYGIVKRVRVNRRDGTAISQGIGYVEMSTKEEATTALEYMDGAQIDGVVVSVGIVYESPFDAKAEHRKRSYSHHRHRSRTRSNSRSHSRSRSRSYSRRDRSRRTHRHSHHRSHYRE